MDEHTAPERDDTEPERDGDLGRDPGHGGYFVPPLWGKLIKFVRGRR